jgi:hypothetical protein
MQKIARIITYWESHKDYYMLHVDVTDEQTLDALQAEARKRETSAELLATWAIRIFLAQQGYSTLPKPSELLKLPAGERDFILELSATIAEDSYRSDPELTAFEAYEILD